MSEILNLTVDNQKIVCDRKLLVSDTVNVYECYFTFDEEWNVYAKVAVFMQNGSSYKAQLDSNGYCVLPWESITEKGEVFIGVYGVRGEDGDYQRYPTIWTKPIKVELGCEDGKGTEPPTPDVYEQLLLAYAEMDLKKVDKVEGKQLSTEDFTTELKNKLESIDPEDMGKVDDVLQNNISVLGEDKIARVTVPTKTSDLTNDDGFITYAALATYATQEYVNNHHDSTKQDAIDDLDEIREGASAGATALQDAPSDNKQYARKNGEWAVVEGGSGASTWDEVQNKPFETLGENLEVVNGQLNAIQPSLEGYATETYVNNHHDSTKQDTIDDLEEIREGAQAGSTAVQPSAISDMATQTWVEEQGYLTEHQSLANYDTKDEVNTKIANHHDSTKQDTISDLDDIREGAGLGSTSIQPNDNISELTNNAGYITNSALSGYATEQYVNNHHDTSKQDTITDLEDIRSGAEAGSTAVQPAAISDMATMTWAGQQGWQNSSQVNSSISTHNSSSSAHSTLFNAKQDNIDDLEDIRSGAALGSSAVQPNAISDMATQTWVGQQGYQNSSQVDTKISNHNSSTTAHQDIRNAIPQIVDNVTSTDTNKGLSANQGKLLNDRLNNIAGRGRFLSLWNCVTGLPLTNPSGYPYTYHTGDFFIVNNTGATNYIPNGSEYTGQPSTTVYTGDIKVNDTIFYDGTNWMVFDTPAGTGDVQDVYQNGESVVSEGIAYVVTPTKVSDLTNDEGYITGISGSDVTTALGFTPYNATNPSGYQTSQQVESAITSKGYITGINSTDVTTALGYTPYNSTNPNGYQNASQVDNAITAKGYTTMDEVEAKGYITGIDSSDVTTALGYTPYNSTNPNGYQTAQQVDSSITAKGYTTMGAVEAKGYITGIDSGDVTDALGYTPYNSSNPSGYQNSTQVNTAITNYHDTTKQDKITSTNKLSYNLLSDTPTIPTVPTNVSAFTNDSGYITSSALTGYATRTWVGQQGFASEDDLSDVAFSGDYTDLLNKPTLPRKVIL